MMKRTILTLCCLLASLFMTQAQNTDEAAIRRRLNEATARITAMACDFVQTKHLSMLKDKMVSKGRMCYKKSDRLRWEYTSPYTYVFILNGNEVLLKNKNRSDIIDVEQNKMFREIVQIMLSSVVGNCLDDKNFKSSLKATATEYVATLTPQRKNMKQMFREIVLHFDRKNACVRLVELIEKNDDRTIIELNNIRMNEALADHLFLLR
jgi:outer membrane lipoprotein carrier protein